ncbi:hypothetical protein AVEN_88878-1 [Araneus ventricosus]|uniref:Uncharacterized protein n=1 Tax=Araneus ventricosus TaxID=182803 RepID=A0A4Y2RA58_ARAVE|nr:hypothetical protein AVEN_88878-1 [Araneus ventricosus]
MQDHSGQWRIGQVASLHDGKWVPLDISQYGPSGCVCIREKGKDSFSSKFPALFLSKIANSFMLKPHNLFYAEMGRNNHKIFILLGGSRQEGGDSPFVQKGFGPCRWLNNALFVVICAFYCRKTEGQANSSVF